MATNEEQKMTPEEVNALREHIRMEERAKLQTRLEKLDTLQSANDDLANKLSALTSELAKTKESLDSLQKSTSSGNVDVEKLIREVSVKTEQRFRDETNDRMLKLENIILTMDKENKRLKIDSYMQKRMGEETAKGTKFIRELVTGASEVEIENSLLSSIAKYRDYFGTAPAAAPNNAGSPPAASASGNNGNETTSTTVSAGVSPVRSPVESGNSALRTTAPGSEEGVQSVIDQIKAKKAPKARSQYLDNREALLDAANREAERAGANPIVR